jgi:hypothetical protein
MKAILLCRDNNLPTLLDLTFLQCFHLISFPHSDFTNGNILYRKFFSCPRYIICLVDMCLQSGTHLSLSLPFGTNFQNTFSKKFRNFHYLYLQIFKLFENTLKGPLLFLCVTFPPGSIQVVLPKLEGTSVTVCPSHDTTSVDTDCHLPLTDANFHHTTKVLSESPTV